MEQSPPHAALCPRQAKSSSASNSEACSQKKKTKTTVSVDHGIHFPGKACGTMKEKLPLDSTQANGKIEKVEVDKILHPLNRFAQLFLLLFSCLYVTGVIKRQLQDCQQMI